MIDNGLQRKLPGEGVASLTIVLEPPLYAFHPVKCHGGSTLTATAQHILWLVNGALSIEEVN